MHSTMSNHIQTCSLTKLSDQKITKLSDQKITEISTIIPDVIAPSFLQEVIWNGDPIQILQESSFKKDNGSNLDPFILDEPKAFTD